MKRILAIVLILVCLAGCSENQEKLYVQPENRLILWTCLEEAVYEPLVKEFQERTGIWVRVETGTAQALLSRLPEEKCDVFLGAEAVWLEAHSELFQKCDVQADFVPGCPSGRNWVPISQRPVVLVYNPKLVHRNPPREWSDLISSTWTEQISMADPECSDFSIDLLLLLTKENPVNSDSVLSAFRKNLKELSSSNADAVSRVISGSYFLTALPEDLVIRRMASGASLAVSYPEKTYLAVDGGAIPRDADHLENAQMFLEFVLSANAQNYMQKYCNRGSVLENLAVIPEDACFPSTENAAEDIKTLREAWNAVWEERP